MRQQQRDIALLIHSMRDLNDRQAQLFLLLNTLLLRYEAPELQPVVDEDVAEAAASLASTYETAMRGVIYEHRAGSAPAERLAAALKPLLAEAGQNGGTAFERDAAVVLRTISAAARDARELDVQNSRAYLDLLARTLKKDLRTTPWPSDEPRLIVP